MTCMVPAMSMLPSALAAGVDRFGQVDAKAVPVGQAHDARAVNGTIDMACKARNEWVCLAGAAEEGDVHAVHVMLVDQHGDVAAGFEHAQQLERRVETGRDQRAHGAFADFDDRIARGADVGPTVEHSGVEVVLDRNQRRQFPIAEMGGEDQSGLAVAPQVLKRADRFPPYRGYRPARPGRGSKI